LREPLSPQNKVGSPKAFPPRTGPSLQEICADSGVVFAVVWMLKDDLLQVAEHWNPNTRVEKVKGQTSTDDLYTTESYKFKITPGKGIVGKVYLSGEPEFFEDVAQLSSDVYIRADLARKYGIQSVAMMPYQGGVLEIGTDLEKEWGRSWMQRFYGRLE